jgi:hypothetical protein
LGGGAALQEHKLCPTDSLAVDKLNRRFAELSLEGAKKLGPREAGASSEVVGVEFLSEVAADVL